MEKESIHYKDKFKINLEINKLSLIKHKVSFFMSMFMQ